MWESLGRDFLEIAIEQAGNVQKLAEITGIPRSTIQRWQSGSFRTLQGYGTPIARGWKQDRQCRRLRALM